VQRTLAISNLLKVLPCDLGGYFDLAFATQIGEFLNGQLIVLFDELSVLILTFGCSIVRLISIGSSLRKELDIALLQVTQDGTLKSLLQKYNFYTTAQ
jgi:hypothetical protein